MKLISLFLFLIPAIAFSSTYTVETPKLIGADKKIVQVLAELLKSSLEVEGQSIVEKNAEYSLTSKLMKLNSTYILSVRKSKKGKGVAKQIKIKSLDDLDKATLRAIKALVKDKSVEKSVTKKTATEDDHAKLRAKTEPTRNWIIGFGPGWYRDMDSTKARNIIFGYAWGLDYNFDLLLKYEFSYAKDHDLATRSDLALLGGTYYLVDSKNTPYITGDFGFGTFKTDVKDVTGWG
ncbi:MAG: hypothetical protein KAG61_03330, partial [Bacteriovoracaceae bacterium]|nr:hypothetical protein [Bacteriovoracaceae bacterium]